MTNQNLPPDLAEQMFNDRKIRTAIVRKSHFWFFHFYFPHYVTYETAPFQRELFHYTERSDIKNLYIVAFRGSGKSTMIPAWCPEPCCRGRISGVTYRHLHEWGTLNSPAAH